MKVVLQGVLYGLSLFFMGMGILWAVELFLGWAMKPKQPPEVFVSALLEPGKSEPEQVLRWLDSRGFGQGEEQVLLLDCGLSKEERLLYRALGRMWGFSFVEREPDGKIFRPPVEEA